MNKRTWGSPPPKHLASSVESQIAGATWARRLSLVVFLSSSALLLYDLYEGRGFWKVSHNLPFMALAVLAFVQQRNRLRALRKTQSKL